MLTHRTVYRTGKVLRSEVTIDAAAANQRHEHHDAAVTTLAALAAEKRGESWASGSRHFLDAGLRGEPCPASTPLPVRI